MSITKQKKLDVFIMTTKQTTIVLENELCVFTPTETGYRKWTPGDNFLMLNREVIKDGDTTIIQNGSGEVERLIETI